MATAQEQFPILASARVKSMKPARLPLLALALGDALVQTSFVSAQSVNDGLVAYYPFNGNAHDASGNGNDGLAIGVTPMTDRFERDGSCHR